MKEILILLVVLISKVTFAAYGFPSCGVGHCSKFNVQINQACISAGQAGKPFPVVGPQGEICTCPCSCVVSGTQISMANYSKEKIENVEKNSLVFNPYSNKLESRVDTRIASPVTNHEIYKLTLSDETILLTSENHTFIYPSEVIASSQRLRVGDKILAEDLTPREVLNIEKVKYSGDLLNLVTSAHSKEVSDHILSTNGILSGDILLQDANDRLQNEIELRMNVVTPINLEN